MDSAPFDPKTTTALTSAFEAAWLAYCREAHRAMDEDEAAGTRDLLAQRIIRMAQLGERDQAALVADALAHLHHLRHAAVPDA